MTEQMSLTQLKKQVETFDKTSEHKLPRWNDTDVTYVGDAALAVAASIRGTAEKDNDATLRLSI